MARDPWLDNVKFTLVTLVVIGHSLGLLGATALDLQVYDFIYYWHIPAFVLLSGHLSKGFEWDRRHLSSLFTTIALPYLMFEPALLYFRREIDQPEDGPMWLEPHWAMWYLCVLFFWRLATPLLKRHWVACPLAVGVSLLGGLSDELIFCLPRILGLLPFFVLGLHLRREHLKLLTAWWVKPFALAALVWIFRFSAHTDEWARSAFLYYDQGYEALGFSDGDAMVIRAKVMAIGLLGLASVLALIPRRASVISTMGSSTLVVYLFHGFVVRYADYRGWVEPYLDNQWLSLTSVIGSAIALSLFLAAPPVARVLTWIVDPVGSVRRLRYVGGSRSLARQREDDTGDSRRDRPRVGAGSP
ncbi:acyltransferase family protein [Nocardioides sp. Root140]|uniref:acyltransferase family protein n=1 Tax=Nocardioides sp. Root140 TaxID=1736460 RepID=UPI0006FD88A5|nr:acyltransferase family protein [Nocardioides sp. Root140]KQY56827.1 hypothetical protein ASD30_11035 [Nocardioides sp. Root140]